MVRAENLAPCADEAEWLGRIRKAARVLFWTALCSVVLSNVLGFYAGAAAVTFGATKWISLIPVAASIVIAGSVFAITARGVVRARLRKGLELRSLLRVVAVLSALVECIARASEFSGEFTEALALGVAYDIVIFLFQTMLLTYLGTLARQYGDYTLGKWLTVGASSCAFVGTASVASEFACSWMRPTFIAEMRLWGSVTLAALVIEVLGLTLVFLFSARFPRLLPGRCSACGYLLRGLSLPRCPECGTPF